MKNDERKQALNEKMEEMNKIQKKCVGATIGSGAITAAALATAVFIPVLPIAILGAISLTAFLVSSKFLFACHTEKKDIQEHLDLCEKEKDDSGLTENTLVTEEHEELAS